MKIYVNANAARGANGSKESPFKAINDAANRNATAKYPSVYTD